MSAVPNRFPRTTIETYVEHHIEDWDTEDLLAELHRRNVEEPCGPQQILDGPQQILEMFHAMKFGQHDRALELLRVYLMDITGKVLP